nr:MAG TPA: hypothetical protein [Caudoviricetes sp.]
MKPHTLIMPFINLKSDRQNGLRWKKVKKVLL